MIGVLQIECRCAMVGKTLNAAAADEVTLLRSAKVLKGIHINLQRLVWEQIKSVGLTGAVEQARDALATMEEDLRQALLNYVVLGRTRLKERVAHALNQAVVALDMLQLHPIVQSA